MSVLFIQNRPSRAGAQTSLARILESKVFREIGPRVLLGKEGWLSDHLKKLGVRYGIEGFPAPRSLYWRVFGLGSWARKASHSLSDGSVFRAIVANDHQECSLGIALSEALGGVPVLGILRSSAMRERDFRKYRCDACQKLVAVGENLRRKVSEWMKRKVELFEEGFLESEFVTGRDWPQRCPQKVLVIGSQIPGKGFTDFLDALRLLEERNPDFAGWDCHFTGTISEPIAHALQMPFRSRFEFLGRIADFPQRLQSYDFAVHPSRAETFGLAPIESLISGTPTLVSQTGATSKIFMPSDWVFPPRDVQALSRKLENLWKRWPLLDLPKLQSDIRSRFHINQTSAKLRAQIEALLDSPL